MTIEPHGECRTIHDAGDTLVRRHNVLGRGPKDESGVAIDLDAGAGSHKMSR